MTGRGFADHFSGHAAAYARARPGYPPGLFAWLASLAPGVPGIRRAWDCACGSGQASVGLAEHLDAVVATDASVAQLASAKRHHRVAYAACTAEQSPLAPASVGLITVAQALHWLHLDAFYAEVRRVGTPDAVIAVWSYGRVAADAAAAPALDHFYHETLAPWWPPERRHVDEGYASLDFPFTAIATPAIAMEARWTLRELLDYIGTWSAVAAMRRAVGTDPVAALGQELARAWPEEERRAVRWPLTIRAGRVHPR